MCILHTRYAYAMMKYARMYAYTYDIVFAYCETEMT